MEAVSADPGLRSLAADAFRSSVRAYAAHPAALKDVFHVKRLHLGHVAHSFALRYGHRLLLMMLRWVGSVSRWIMHGTRAVLDVQGLHKACLQS